MSVPWEAWSEAALMRARDERRPIALHIGVAWSEACRAMDATSYAYPGVAEVLAARFVCVRVDADRRPDVAERYNPGGWPGFAILDPAGEVLLARTFVPGPELLALLRSATDPGARWTVAPAPPPEVGAATLDAAAVYDRVREAYDPYNHGFGDLEKFPHAPVLDALIDRALRGDAWARGAVEATLRTMAARGVHDAAGGGFFRVATQDDWNAPERVRLLEDQAQLLGVYARAGDPAVVATTARWMLRALADPASGAFHASIADEADVRVDPTLFAGWNGLAAASLVRAGATLGRPGLLAWARRTGAHLLGQIAPDGRVRRHPGGVAGLLDDQVRVAEGLLAVAAVFPGDGADAASRVLDAAWRTLRHPAGGLAEHAPESLGRLRHPRRPMAGNAAFAAVARSLDAVLGATSAAYDGVWRARAAEAAAAALAESDDAGFQAAVAAAAAERLAARCVVVKVATDGWPVPPMLLAALADPHPDVVVVAVTEGVPAGTAVACSGSACARPAGDAASLHRAIAQLRQR